MPGKPLSDLVIAMKGAGEMVSAVAWRLYQANFRRIVMLELPQPLAVRRQVCFSEAVHDGRQVVEGVEAVKASGTAEIRRAWGAGQIAVAVDPTWTLIREMKPDVVVDGTLAKSNLGTTMDEAPLVIGLGPGFQAGRDVHFVIETNIGHDLGRVIVQGSAEADTGIPVEIEGHTQEIVLRAPATGLFRGRREIRDLVRRGEVVGDVEGKQVRARLDGVLRGLIRSGTWVTEGVKLGDVDPRGEVSYCYTIFEKPRAIAGGVLEAVLRVWNRSGDGDSA